MTAERCTMPTRKLHACKRPAVWAYYDGGRIIAAYCAQHDRTPGGRHLRPYPWEYDVRARLVTVFTDGRQIAVPEGRSS